MSKEQKCKKKKKKIFWKVRKKLLEKKCFNSPPPQMEVAQAILRNFHFGRKKINFFLANFFFLYLPIFTERGEINNLSLSFESYPVANRVVLSLCLVCTPKTGTLN